MTDYGNKRTIVGAHYGMRDWLSQRVTAILMVLFTIALIAQVLLKHGPLGYDLWAGIFAAQWMKFLTFVVILALAYHAWVGMRNIWMDYIKPVGLRLVLEVFHHCLAPGLRGLGHPGPVASVSARSVFEIKG